MKYLFYITIVAAILFEVANVFFIMPLPGSQEIESIGIAYFLYRWRWIFRAGLLGLAALGLWGSRWSIRWIPLVAVAVWAGVAYLFNFDMAADHMFYQPRQVLMQPAADNQVDSSRLVIGVEIAGEARAYPIQFIGYHHQVLDTLAGKPIMITYCTVCRSARVFEPVVDGRQETFRLVGMDHFNAMFEDQTTGSWWQQATGEAIIGLRAGAVLPEVPSTQMRLHQWLALHPESLVMQPDTTFAEAYDNMKNYESGQGKSDLTRTDSLSWQRKSWVVGIQTGGAAKAFDWNRLQTERIINETVGATPVVIVVAADSQSFAAFERPSATAIFSLRHDTLVSGDQMYTLAGQPLPPNSLTPALTPITAYQEFWHSWLTFHPLTMQY
ncbi:MAG: DUF3179 domain-containing (seleno)protein [Bacteroidia bacterium]|nr:DUF3179 domain-containing (seleno)protein [Bacteroidia bacterium]